MSDKKKELIRHLVYMDSPPREGEGYQWLGCYILKYGKVDQPKATVGMRELEEKEIELLESSSVPWPRRKANE